MSKWMRAVKPALVSVVLISSAYLVPIQALAFGGAVPPAPQGSCFHYASKVLGTDAKYCIDEAHSSKNVPANHQRVIFYFHGHNQPIDDWFSSFSPQFHKSMENVQGDYSTTVVSFQTSDLSFFTDKKGISHGPDAYETWLTQELIPLVTEKYHLCNQRSCRAAVGYSMGGFGALKTALRHPGLFSEVAVSSPALGPFNPFDNDFAWAGYFARNPVGPIIGFMLLNQLRDVFGTAEYFEENNPITLLKNYPASQPLPKLYMDVFQVDYYGFHEGFGVLEDVLKDRGIAYESKVRFGVGHMDVGTLPDILGFVFNNLLGDLLLH